MTTSLTIGQILGLNNILTEYPMGYDFDTIFTMIYVGDEDVTVQENFKNWNTDDLYNFIKGLAKDIDSEIELAMR